MPACHAGGRGFESRRSRQILRPESIFASNGLDQVRLADLRLSVRQSILLQFQLGRGLNWEQSAKVFSRCSMNIRTLAESRRLAGEHPIVGCPVTCAAAPRMQCPLPAAGQVERASVTPPLSLVWFALLGTAEGWSLRKRFRIWKSQLSFERNEPRIVANRVEFWLHRHEYQPVRPVPKCIL
jgi:hypothetical protein